jgi:hypothetical protein
VITSVITEYFLHVIWPPVGATNDLATSWSHW